MSWQSAVEPEARTPPSCKALETVIVPRPRDIGGFEVRRVLPSAERQSVGPFVFFDQMGPADLAPGSGIDVRPHPHIGLAQAKADWKAGRFAPVSGDPEFIPLPK